ncbi:MULTISPECIES: glutamate--tRNA ligase [Bacteroides]|jgi:glutamyl-tRNA synthetase|uniref:Glutamate--tRNA ligase n=2 Tax=Bacteroides acidifaciens TaxID=85831 RepID=A0A7J0A4X0_9BACE|nr:glutamate--tRNA ligase [Bacteroides acidifaciens]MBF0731657.1 glutamate--tRNA ligase [Bacteroides acidifaciens]MBF0834502.1 glutamate--tRNA ligase [Bacteroides acidifaciens]MCR1999681.1 glutamate--tRNA ligase [Bacteroides acidifaciens]MCR2006431.1 glutamate--tRNA ligase [Bacteroides acidifaciens]NDO55454.1 glutamate--tRNA ligase [Bacteroides acidifaciens]
MAERKVRVRFAPSPTGALHIGGVRTALYNYLFARQHNGDLIFRIEDTDSHRFVPGAEEYILESFKWLGIHFDEGVSFGGEHGPYRQSERREIYKKYVQVLLENGKAYIAFDTPEELDAKRAEIANFQYDASTRGMMRNSLTMPKEEVDALIAEGKQYVVRFKIEPNEDVRVNDLIRGEVIINSSILDDKVLYKSADELPTYHLANIVDDHLMEVSHVIRGEEWLPSAPLHVLLYRAFGWEDTMPEFAHLPLLLKPEGNGKLSKRDGDRLGFPVFPLEWHDPKSGDVSSGYRESGYLPEAVINFLALLGWNPGNDQEVMSMDELVKLFDLNHCSKSGAKFDYKKGTWFNHEYIMMKPDAELAQLFKPVLAANGVDAAAYSDAYLAKVVSLVKGRVNFVKELWDQSRFFFAAPTQYAEKDVKKRWSEDTPRIMGELITVLEGIADFSSKPSEDIVIGWITEKGYHMGNVMNAFRLAVVGECKGPHMFDITELLGKDETISRIRSAVEKLG